MSGSYYALNAKYNQLLALINAGGGGGGGSVNNPMTSDLNAGGYNITNVANITGVGGGFTGAAACADTKGAPPPGCGGGTSSSCTGGCCGGS